MKKTIILDIDEISKLVNFPLSMEENKMYEVIREVKDYMWQGREYKVIITFETEE